MENRNSYSISLLFFRFRNSPLYSFSVVATTITVSIILLFLLVIPQYQQLLLDQQEINKIRERIQILKKNKAFIASLDKNALESNFQTITSALPPDKDYAGVLNAIASSVVESSVALQDYEFRVGPLASKSGMLSTKNPITLQLSLLAPSEGTQLFMEIMNQKLPLSSELSAKTSDLDKRITEVAIAFHSQDFPIITIDAKKTIQPLSEQDNTLIQMLEEWKVKSESIGLIDFADIASTSGNVRPF